jgi:hypothetical protein
MGLDQYATAVKDDEKIEFFYWRKHNRLQGYMKKLYESKGGTECFNCEDVELTLTDLEQLEAVVCNKKLPATTGFFFGSDSYSDEWIDEMVADDLKFIDKAREHIKNGYAVVYSSWW